MPFFRIWFHFEFRFYAEIDQSKEAFPLFSFSNYSPLLDPIFGFLYSIKFKSQLFESLVSSDTLYKTNTTKRSTPREKKECKIQL